MLFNVALEMAITSKSTRGVLQVLNCMLEGNPTVYPTARMTQRLAVVARQIIEVHELVQKFVEVNKMETAKAVDRRKALLTAQVEEHKLRRARIGKHQDSKTIWQSALKGMRNMALQRHGKKKMGQSFLPVETIKLLKDKGGDMYAAKKDRPAPAREMHM